LKKKIDDNIKENLEYIGLDLNKIPEILKEYEPLSFRPNRSSGEKRYYQYKYVPIKDIEILLSPTNRLDDLVDRYKKAIHISSYLNPDNEENMIKHITFLNMLKKVKKEDIEKIDKEQKVLNKAIPFKVKYPNNYLWQIYYSEVDDRYFAIVPTEDTEYSTFFYILKKQIEKKRTGKIFVPISGVEYTNKYLKKSEYTELENYLWLFTKDWPYIYDVYDKNDELSIYITGETEITDKIKSSYRIKLTDEKEASKFYKLVKTLFILQTELPRYFKFETNIGKSGELKIEFNGKEITYDNLLEFIKEEYQKLIQLEKQNKKDLKTYNKKNETLKEISVKLELEYLEKEKQISTYLKCKKSFIGKFKYFIKYKKKTTLKYIDENKREKIMESVIQNDKKEINFGKGEENHTLEELLNKYKEYAEKETELQNLIKDINSLILKNKNMIKKIENAIKYIEEIDKHKKSIFEFWKYSNKDEILELEEGEKEEINVKKISTIFNYEDDKENFGQALDSIQRKKLTNEELDSIFMTTTKELDMINKIKTEQKIMVKELNEKIKILKEEMSEERLLTENEEFDMFGTLITDDKKIKKISNKEHREKSRDKFKILDITKKTTKMDYKEKIQEIIDNITRATQKIESDRDIVIYKASVNENLNKDEINIFNINSKDEIEKALGQAETMNLFKINLKRGTNLIGYSNIVFFENSSKTLPVGMDLSDNILVDLSKVNLKEIKRKQIRIVDFEKGDADILKEKIREVSFVEYETE